MNKALAEQLRKMSKEQQPTVVVNIDMTPIAEALKENKQEYQKVDGLTPSVS